MTLDKRKKIKRKMGKKYWYKKRRSPISFEDICSKYVCVESNDKCFTSFETAVRAIYFVTQKGRSNYSPDRNTFMISQDKGKFWVVVENLCTDNLFRISIYTSLPYTGQYGIIFDKYWNEMKRFEIVLTTKERIENLDVNDEYYDIKYRMIHYGKSDEEISKICYNQYILYQYRH